VGSKVAAVFACQSCGATSPKWLGRCPECGEWNSFAEEMRGPAPRSAATSPDARALAIGRIEVEERPRLTTGLDGLDRVLGGGLVPGSVVLIGGEPGIGKSTLLLQAGRGLAVRERDVLYASAEESAPQVRLRGGRLGIHEERLLVLAETDVSRIVAEAEDRKPAVVVIDSVQAVREPSLASAPGTVSQVRAAASELTRYAKSRGVPVLLVGHVTKDGSLAGPKSLEHLVDAVVAIEGDRGSARRLLRATKNRFGPVDEIALYEMTSDGLRELPDASATLLAERKAGLAGSAVTAAREGTRSVLVEIQALVGGPSSGSPRRVGIGVDSGRLALLLAVLEGGGLSLATREVFVSCTGGIEVTEPSADLAIVAALVSSARGKPLPDESLYFGEIGLLGEVRRVPAASSRLKEASALGFRNVFLPAGNAGEAAAFPDLAAVPIHRVADLLTRVGGNSGGLRRNPEELRRSGAAEGNP
jgi:DNA repair protein RadA/Sms